MCSMIDTERSPRRTATTPETAPSPNSAGTTAKVAERRVEQRVRERERERRDRDRGDGATSAAAAPAAAGRGRAAPRRPARRAPATSANSASLHAARPCRGRSRRPGAGCRRGSTSGRISDRRARSRAPTPDDDHPPVAEVHDEPEVGAQRAPALAPADEHDAARTRRRTGRRSASAVGERAGVAGRVAGDREADRREHDDRRRCRRSRPRRSRRGPSVHGRTRAPGRRRSGGNVRSTGSRLPTRIGRSRPTVADGRTDRDGVPAVA